MSVQNEIEALPSAEDRVDEIAARAGSRQAILFLDFDGTLAPIVEHPEQAALPGETRELLAELASRRTLAIVSGRDLDDLRPRVGVDGLYYAGSHGFRLGGPGGFEEEHEEARRFRPALARAQRRLDERLASLAGVEVERKRYAVAVHFRRARGDAPAEVRSRVEELARGCDALRLGEGRKVLELRPAIDWDKGRAVVRLLEVLGLRPGGVFPIYVGDDVTDEDAFRAVEDGGLPVVVRGREGRTRARYALEDPVAVRRFLARLDEALSRA